MSDADREVALAFVGYADRPMGEDASRYEDEVLQLLGDHGGKVLFRGRRRVDQDDSMPLEVDVLRFPSRVALNSYLDDDRRHQLLA